MGSQTGLKPISNHVETLIFHRVFNMMMQKILIFHRFFGAGESGASPPAPPAAPAPVISPAAAGGGGGAADDDEEEAERSPKNLQKIRIFGIIVLKTL